MEISDNCIYQSFCAADAPGADAAAAYGELTVLDIAFWVQGFGFIMILIYLICGLDDLVWFLIAVIDRFRHPEKKDEDEMDFRALRSTPPKMLAVVIAAWHEANVIGDVVSNIIETVDYPASMYHIFVGVYPNDPDTMNVVNELGKRFPNVHTVVDCMEGPTTKAQNVNNVIGQISRFEALAGISFAALIVHDSEDVVHAYEFLAANYLIERYDALQFPVFPILEMPGFGNFFRQLTTATYADEFAENHYITMVDRRNISAFVPCAGTGFALSRSILEAENWKDILPSDSLTEDYLMSLSLYKKGIQLHYVLDKLPRLQRDGRVRNDFIATRALFPNRFKAAVRQKTRWTYGITMQSIGIRDVFTKEHVPLSGRYSFYKDAKSKLVNLVPVLGYAASIYCLLSVFLNLEPMYLNGTAAYYMSWVVFGLMVLRQTVRAYALYHVYGARTMFFGCLFPPLFPIRMIYGNVINFTAAVRAFRMRLQSRKKAKMAASGRKGKADAKAAPRKKRPCLAQKARSPAA